MTDELTVRRYRPVDKNAVWRVYEQAFREASSAFVPELDRDLRRIPETYLRDGEFLVGTVAGEIVAVGEFLPVDGRAVNERSADEQSASDRVVELRRMGVDPAYQRNGNGSALLRTLEDSARERGARRAVLHTSDRLGSAIEFYRAQGYRETDREPHPEADMTLVYFEKRLGE